MAPSGQEQRPGKAHQELWRTEWRGEGRRGCGSEGTWSVGCVRDVDAKAEWCSLGAGGTLGKSGLDGAELERLSLSRVQLAQRPSSSVGGS